MSNLDLVAQKAKEVLLLALDVDGVLTNGMLYYDEHGGESKRFSVRDGMGLKLLQEAGVEVAIISGRRSLALSRRAHELGIVLLFQGIRYKKQLLAQLLQNKGLDWPQVGYMGDDINDLACMEAVGLPMAPADAACEVLAKALFVAQKPGGLGAVREACELIIKAKGQWHTLAQSYFSQ